MSMTSHPARVFPAMASHGNPAGVSLDQRPHVRAGSRAGAGDPVQHGRRARPGPGPAVSSGRSARPPAPGPGAPAPRCRSCSWRPARSRPPSTPARSPGRAAATCPLSAAPRSGRRSVPPGRRPCGAGPRRRGRPGRVPPPVTFRAWSHRVSCMAKSAPVSGKLHRCGDLQSPRTRALFALKPARTACSAGVRHSRADRPAPIRCTRTQPATARNPSSQRQTIRRTAQLPISAE